MVKNLLLSTENRIKSNIRYLTPMDSQTSYSRHLSMRSERRSINGKNRMIIHVSIRPHKHQYNHQNSTVESLNNIDSPSEIRSIQTPWDHQSLPPSVSNERDDQIVFQRNNSSLNSKNRIRTKTNSILSGNKIQIMKKEDWSSNTNDLVEKSGKRKRKKNSPVLTRRCKWMIFALILALILAAAIAGILAATLIKPDTTIMSTITTTSETTISTTTVTTTTAPSTTTSSTTSTTITTSSTASTTTTTSSTTTTTTTTSSTTSATTTTSSTTSITTTTSIVTTTTATTTTATTQSTTVSRTTTTTSTTTTLLTIVKYLNGSSYECLDEECSIDHLDLNSIESNQCRTNFLSLKYSSYSSYSESVLSHSLLSSLFSSARPNVERLLQIEFLSPLENNSPFQINQLSLLTNSTSNIDTYEFIFNGNIAKDNSIIYIDKNLFMSNKQEFIDTLRLIFNCTNQQRVEWELIKSISSLPQSPCPQQITFKQNNNDQFCFNINILISLIGLISILILIIMVLLFFNSYRRINEQTKSISQTELIEKF